MGEDETLDYHLGISNTYSNNGIVSINMNHYVKTLLADYKMETCTPVTTPLAHSSFSASDSPTKDSEEWKEMQKIPFRELICKLAHLSRTVRPDIAFAVGVLSRFMDNPGKVHWLAAKRILRYLKFSPCTSLLLSPGDLAKNTGKLRVTAYVDADHAGDSDSSKSTTGYFIFVGDALTSWCSKLQSGITTSSTHAEHYATYQVTIDIIWHQNILRSMNLLDEDNGPTIIHGDCQPSQNLASDWMVTSRSKHFDIKFRYINEQVDKKLITFKHISGSENPADCLTKVVPADKLSRSMSLAGLRSEYVRKKE
jgi:hypothetical protein